MFPSVFIEHTDDGDGADGEFAIQTIGKTEQFISGHLQNLLNIFSYFSFKQYIYNLFKNNPIYKQRIETTKDKVICIERKRVLWRLLLCVHLESIKFVPGIYINVCEENNI